MIIPQQLNKENIRFILLGNSGDNLKRPIEKWQDFNYTYDDTKLKEHIGNYGIMCGNNLIVMDSDTKEFDDIIQRNFKETFTIKTSKGKHYYYFCEEFNQKKVLKRENEHLGEIQSGGAYVVGPNSIHPSGIIYEVINDIPITTIPKYLVDNVLKSFYSSERLNKEIILNGATEGLRNDSMFKLACSFRARGLTPDETLFSLKSINEKNNPPLSDFELRNIVESSFKYKENIQSTYLKEAMAIITSYKDYFDLANQFWKTQPFFYSVEQIWWLWDFKEFKWKIVDEVSIMNEIDKALNLQPYTISSKVKNEIIETLKRIGRKNIPKEAPLKWIQFKDKAFSLKSGKIYQVEPNYFFTNPIPYALGEIPETPTMDKLFIEWVGKEYLVDLYELIAYCCYRSYPIQTLVCFYGGGRNGKTSFLKILDKFMGTDNITTTELDMLTGFGSSRFESFKLYKKLVCLMGETNFGVLDKSSILKKLVGGDRISFEMKNKLPFTEYNYAKIIIASNSLPTCEDTSEGFYRRWMIIDFPNEFPEGKDITLTIPEIEFNNLARKCVEILPKLLEKGEFTHQGTIQERKEKYQMASNPLPKFIEIFCYQNSEGYIRYSEFFTLYCKFLTKNKRRNISRREFSKYLTSEGYENRKTSKNGIIDYYVENLEWKKEFYLLPNLLDFNKFDIDILNINNKIKIKKVFPDFLDFPNFLTRSSHRETNKENREIEEIEEKLDIQDIVVSDTIPQDIVVSEEKIDFSSKKDKIFIENGENEDKNLFSTGSGEVNPKSIILDVIQELSDHYKIIPVEKVTFKNIEISQIEEIINQLKKEGTIFEPKAGFIQLLN